MTSIEQWEDFLQHNTEEYKDTVYSFSSDINFLEIFPNGCDGLIIYPEIDGFNTTWKNLFMIGPSPLEFINGVSHLNFENMFVNANSCIKWGKKLTYINVSVSIGGVTCTLSNNVYFDGITPEIHHCNFVIAGRPNVLGLGGTWNHDYPIENCFIYLDMDTVVFALDDQDAYNTTIQGRVYADSYIRSALHSRECVTDVDPESPDPENPDYILIPRTNSAIFNFVTDSRSTQFLDYHWGFYNIYYNQDISDFPGKSSDYNGWMQPVTTEDITSGSFLYTTDPKGVRHPLPYWKISNKFHVPVYEDFADADIVELGTFKQSHITEITLPATCKYCKNSFPAGTTIHGGVLADYRETD